ncbi:TIGR01548 family HAD-type hydrolase [filamentous cyanobacterium CCP5]|nr:TIGR01548 family HAD-type hydrolase [filamentous cyanobacterium CCP5]
MTCIAVFDIDGVLRDVSGSYRRAIADTVEAYTDGQYRPQPDDIDTLKREGCWNNDWEASKELILRYFEGQGGDRQQMDIDFDALVKFFQDRYRGGDPLQPDLWQGYITREPLLVSASYFAALSQAQVGWGFFSGATRSSALYVLQRRLGLNDPPLIAMEDAPGKPDPTGLLAIANTLSVAHQHPTAAVVYVGDTVADMHTALAASRQDSPRTYIGVGILPPHVRQRGPAYTADYRNSLHQAGAALVLNQVTDLTPEQLNQITQAT